jgi:D-alanine-D-alanine ligase-like ATP-grasp enzyme
MQKRKSKRTDKKISRKTPYLTGLVQRFGKQAGAKVLVEPTWKYAAQLTYKNGTRRYLRYLTLDLNHVGASDIAKDKDFAKFFMKKMGYPVAKGKVFFKPVFARAIGSTDSYESAERFAKKLGFPLIVKPNSLSQGSCIALVRKSSALKSALKQVFEQDRAAIVEEYRPGKDYRIVVLDNEIISAYERKALEVVGDGTHTIKQLLVAKQKLFEAKKRDTRIDSTDVRIRQALREQKKTWKSVLKDGEVLVLMPNANLSTGGESVDVTKTIHPGYKKIAIALTRDMGLRIAGVDIMVTHGDITEAPQKKNFFIIEINASPGLDHYVTTGKEQKKIVEDMYLKVLRAMAKK